MQATQSKIAFKKLARHDFYNILQDMRHYLIIDFRSKYKYDESFIRNSINLDMDSTNLDEDLKKLSTTIDNLEKSAVMMEKKYKFAKIRRAIFLDEDDLNEESPKYRTFFAFFKENLPFDKYYTLNKGFKDFQQKYPFLCLSSKTDPNPYNLKDNLELYSLSRFPSEIIEDNLFLGDVYNSNNERQLNDLTIKSLIDFIEYPEECIIPKFKKKLNFEYINIPIDPKTEVTLDFDEICKQIDNCLLEKKGPVLIYCKDGDKISPGIAIAFLMFKKNLKLQIASLSVFQKRSCVEIEKWVYTQLLNYNPNSKDKK